VVDKVQLGLPAGTVGYFIVGNINLYGVTVEDMDFGRAAGGTHIAYAVFYYFF
jgi:hypothetical protein